MDAQKMEVGALRSLLTGLAAVAGLVAVAGCAGDRQEGPAQGGVGQTPDQVISDFNLTETAGGQKDWMMEAYKAYIYEKRNVVEADLVRITFFGEAGRVRSVVSARNGKLDRNTSDMEARGDVRVTGSDGVELRTETLTWNSKGRQISSDDSVTVLRRGDVLTGWGFRGDPDLGSFEILRSMKATIRQDAGSGEAASE
jgi:LPS export ABC transporter protein LptC